MKETFELILTCPCGGKQYYLRTIRRKGQLIDLYRCLSCGEIEESEAITVEEVKTVLL